MNSESLLNEVFFPRSSFLNKDEKDHLIEVEDGIHVSARFNMTDKKNPSILFFHGNAELAQEYDEIAYRFNQSNCNFIVADYRGYGLSNGVPTKGNLNPDANKIFSYVKSFLLKNNYSGKIIIMGRSLGSASACEIISNYESEISGFIIESGFATELPLMNILDLIPSDINYSPSDGFENLKKLVNYKKPILIIHAEDDDIIPIREAELMHEKVGSNQKDLCIIKNANHNNILIQSPEEYFLRIEKFISNLS